ncbi:protein of unknown function [Ruminococcaceae bacterium YRB3002]|nr:protein of unknown function [Ruminococcaceae bacterium YRB3002]
MAFASMFIVFIVLILIVLGIQFLVGLIMLIIGLVNSKRAKKVWPVLLDILGVVNMVPLIAAIVGTVYFYNWSQYNKEHMLEKYDSVPEAWMNESFITEQQAAGQALNALIAAASSGDRDEFVENFSEVTQEREDFDELIDAFMEEFPEGLSYEGFKRSTGRSLGTSEGYGTRSADATYRGKFNGEWYFIRIKYCYNGDSDDEIGVFYLSMMNLSGEANYQFGDTEYNKNNDTLYLYAYMPGSDEVNARMINNYPKLWEESDGPVLTADEMREVLAGYDTLQDAIDAGAIGHPNCNPLYNGVNLHEYYYELQPVNGEPRYAFIRTSGDYGAVQAAYEYTETSGDYDNPIVEHRVIQS